MYKINVIKGDKNLNDIFVNILNDMIAKNNLNCACKTLKDLDISDK